MTKTWQGGKAQHGTSDWKPGPPPWYCECCSGIHTAAQPGLCTGTHFHSPPPGSGWRHCDVTPNTEKGTAHLPCYQNNTLVDNYWIAFKQFCLHTSQNALDCGFYSHVESTSTRPAPQLREPRSHATSEASSRDGDPKTDSPWCSPEVGSGLATPCCWQPPPQGKRYVSAQKTCEQRGGELVNTVILNVRKPPAT